MKEIIEYLENTSEKLYDNGKIWYILIGVIGIAIYILYKILTT